MIEINNIKINYSQYGNTSFTPLIMINSLGADHTLWDSLISVLKNDFFITCYDKRGHGSSDAGNDEYSIELHMNDLLQLMSKLEIKKALICGISVGGMIAQKLAASHPHKVEGLILCNTAVKIGTKEFWTKRVADLSKNRLTNISDAIVCKWFSQQYDKSKTNKWRNMLNNTSTQGYIGTCKAIIKTDLTEISKTITAPTLIIGAEEDVSTPPDNQYTLSKLIKGSRVRIIKEAGHLPCIEKPDILAKHIMEFIKENDFV